jgi:hypothetical protein
MPAQTQANQTGRATKPNRGYQRNTKTTNKNGPRSENNHC